LKKSPFDQRKALIILGDYLERIAVAAERAADAAENAQKSAEMTEATLGDIYTLLKSNKPKTKRSRSRNSRP
jgi:hypothetical protein